MAPQPSRSQIRLLAPAALVVCTLAFGVVIVSAGGGGGGDDSEPASDTTTQPKAGKQPRTTPKAAPRPATYTVKTGDNLGSISAKTKVPVETIQELNPELDPQALVSGQKIKLKE